MQQAPVLAHRGLLRKQPHVTTTRPATRAGAPGGDATAVQRSHTDAANSDFLDSHSQSGGYSSPAMCVPQGVFSPRHINHKP